MAYPSMLYFLLPTDQEHVQGQLLWQNEQISYK